MSVIYLIGSLRNPAVPVLAEKIREQGHEVFDDWYAAGEFADRAWQDYEVARGHTYNEALQGYAAQHVFQYDKSHIQRCDTVVLLMPCGRSGHIEWGWAARDGKRAYVLFQESVDRYDVMYNFGDGVFTNELSLFNALKGDNDVY